MADPGVVSAWGTFLASPTELLLPTDYPRPVPLRVVEAEQTYKLQSDDVAKLDALAGKLGTSAERALLALFGIVLARHAGEEDICVGGLLDTSVDNTNNESTWTNKQTILRFRVEKDATLAQLGEAVGAAHAFAATNAVPLHDLLNALFPVDPAAPAPPALLRVRYMPVPHGAQVAIQHAPHLTSDLALLPVLDGNSSAALRFVYNALLFSTERIDDMNRLLVQLFSMEPTDLVYDVSLITNEASKVVPDPIASLDWEGFRGAITDILHANAAKHPERVCVVQSLADGGEIPYSYAQVETASNVLANHLIAAGVKRADVVTLYAARSADMVAAVLGVLKSGGIFNVLDPAYPVDRQKIYLSVAKPKALVVLDKAGEIDQAVLDYIDETLPGIPFVEKVMLDAEGNISSPSITKADPSFPGIQLGPDSPATLSFTSGSTGLPKGVQGRHFSLTHFYPWMSQKFGLSSESRFTMLSGIAHDPIQRDIFTPLFLGASLHVPTADDIGEPGRLARWMASRKCSVTHLTPAMGQLLTANATALMPDLTNAFFVGDVLTLRDVRRLQALARNCSVINMYGTTETQRAVSHYVVPPGINLDSWKEVVPAGKGMHDVQLLVVSGEGEKRQMAGIGEVGELYVRSGGLAEGYLEGGAEKFVANFFAWVCGLPRTRQVVIL